MRLMSSKAQSNVSCNAAFKLICDHHIHNLMFQVMPQVYRANAMSQELKKPTKFEIVLVSPQARGLKAGPTEVLFVMFWMWVN